MRRHLTDCRASNDFQMLTNSNSIFRIKKKNPRKKRTEPVYCISFPDQHDLTARAGQRRPQDWPSRPGRRLRGHRPPGAGGAARRASAPVSGRLPLPAFRPNSLALCRHGPPPGPRPCSGPSLPTPADRGFGEKTKAGGPSPAREARRSHKPRHLSANNNPRAPRLTNY